MASSIDAVAAASLPNWLRRSAVAWAGALLACLAVLLTVSFVLHERRSLVAGELRQAELHARVLQDHAERSFDTIDLALTSLADASDEATGGIASGRFDADLTRALSGLPFLRSLSLITGDGRVVASSSAANVGVVVDLAAVVLPREGQAEVLGGSVPGRDLVDAQASSAAAARSVRSFVPLVRRVGRAAAQPHYLVAALNPDFFGNAYELALDSPTRRAGLFSVDGVLLAATGNIRKLPGASARGHRFFTAYLPARESGSFVGAGIDGDAVVTAFRVLRQRPLAVIVEASHAHLLADFRQTVYQAAGVCAGALLAIAAMMVLGWRSLLSHELVSAALEATRAEIAGSERDLRLLVESVHELIFRADAQGRIVFVNSRWQQFTRRPVSDVLGRRLSELCREDERAACDDMLALSGASDVTLRVHVANAAGGALTLELSVSRLLGAEGQMVGLAGFAVDVSAREAADSAKSEFIANISHELRTPLQAILGFAELGRDLSGERPDFLDMFADIQAGGQRMLTLVNGLLDVSKMNSAVGSLPLQRVDAAALVREALGHLQAQAAPGALRFDAQGLDVPVPVDADPVRFAQAVRHVLANAVRHSPAGSSIDVRLADKGSFGVELTVRDRGPGVPEDELELIFDAFVQSSRTRDGSGGTGLGLTLARKIMSAHGGSVVAANAPGGGALFSLCLPAAGVLSHSHAALSWQDPDRLLFASEVN